MKGQHRIVAGTKRARQGIAMTSQRRVPEGRDAGAAQLERQGRLGSRGQGTAEGGFTQQGEQEMKWHDITQYDPPKATRVLMTNNLKARDAKGNMSHVWLGMAWRCETPSALEKNGGNTWMGYVDDLIGQPLYCITHWADPFAKPTTADALGAAVEAYCAERLIEGFGITLPNGSVLLNAQPVDVLGMMPTVAGGCARGEDREKFEDAMRKRGWAESMFRPGNDGARYYERSAMGAWAAWQAAHGIPYA